MQELSFVPDMLHAFRLRDWYAFVASAIFAATFLWRRFGDRLWTKIPDGWRWLPPFVFGALGGFVESYRRGEPWQAAVGAMVWGTLLAMGMHSGLKESKLSYGGGPGGGEPKVSLRPPATPMLLVCIALSFTLTQACGASQLAMQRKAADTVSVTMNRVVLPMLRNARDAEIETAVETASTPADADANYAYVRARWERVWLAYDGIAHTHDAWVNSMQTEDEGDVLRAALAMRLAYCDLWKLGPHYKFEVPQFPGQPCT
ncbi:MAG TPA: hypothetical protein VK524_03215 [Polyangiaceae bacterium]|nr:hypothetical protein [Polyangiaceae bacterium]